MREPLEATGRREPRLLESMKNLMATSLAIAQTRLELVAVELETEIIRFTSLLLFAASALFSFALGVLLIVFFIIVLFWDTHRLIAIGLLAGASLVVGAAAWSVFLKKLKDKPRLFAASIGELAKDREQLTRP